MKLKIYQQGGGLIYTPFIPEQYADSSGRNSKSSSGSDDEDAKIDPLDKELLGLMKDQNLLPSDIQMIYNRLIAFQKSTQRLSSMTGFGGTGSYRSVMPGMLQIMNLVSQARYNKARADSALNQMTKESTGSDVALDKYGRMYVQNMEGKVEKISPKDYDSEKYRPISNSELMYLREQSLPFNSEILSDVVDTVGMSSISKEINRIIDAFGTTKSEGYFDKDVVSVFLALKSPDGIYKLTEEKTSADLRKAWNVIYKQLPTNMRQVLDARAALTESNPVDFIHEIILSNLDYKQGIDYDLSQSKAAGFNTGSGSSDGEKLTAQNTYQYRFGIGDGPREQFLMVPTASAIYEKGAYLAQGTDFGPMLNWDLRPLDPMNLQKMFFSGDKEGNALSASVNTQDITFGNHLVKESERPTIFYNGNSGVTKVYLPWTEENGHIKPDFEKLRQFNAYKKEIKDAGNITPTERNAILAKYPKLTSGDVIPSEDGKSFILRNTKPFMAFSAFAGDDTIKFTKDELLFLRKLDKSEAKRIKDLYNSYVKYDKAYGDKKKDALNRNYAESESGDFWEGIVFVSANNSAWYSFNTSMNEAISKESTQDISEKVMANEWLNEITEEARSNPNYNELSRIGQHF